MKNLNYNKQQCPIENKLQMSWTYLWYLNDYACGKVVISNVSFKYWLKKSQNNKPDSWNELHINAPKNLPVN